MSWGGPKGKAETCRQLNKINKTSCVVTYLKNPILPVLGIFAVFINASHWISVCCKGIVDIRNPPYLTGRTTWTQLLLLFASVCVWKQVKVTHDMAVQEQRGSRCIAPAHLQPDAGSEWSAPRSGRFAPPPRKDPVPILQESALASWPVWTARKISPSHGFDPRTIPPSASFDCPIPATVCKMVAEYKAEHHCSFYFAWRYVAQDTVIFLSTNFSHVS